ncbi:ATP-binding cassette domain-containing protein [Egibacter rhizosphaerae]|uniref:ATP-binding cassette domain-containing protein n=1 Tax=Egibacter rhizosphaerae TaxID=1670831 RepID=A0A411YB69_9ACTN|nr:ATP-binding cassette domain-containing protein [Egibacter rhizosphaerae]
MFTFHHVNVERDGTAVLTDVCAQVPASGITVVIGPSGAGKSTLLRLCNRLDVPTTGTVTYRGADLAGLDPLELRRRVGMVFQTPTPFAGTVRDNLVVAAPAGDDDRFAAALTAAALDPALLDRDADSLSGGEAQRACLARTLVADCEALLLDEPTSALDAAPKHAFERLAVDLAARGTPMLWVTHELAQLQRIADGVLALVDGALVHAGTPEGLRDVAELDTFLSDGGAS